MVVETDSIRSPQLPFKFDRHDRHNRRDRYDLTLFSLFDFRLSRSFSCLADRLENMPLTMKRKYRGIPKKWHASIRKILN
jgi:hypothetical protein